MPGLNGLELQSRLTAERCGIPVTLVTAYDNKESRRQALQGGALAFLPKPFSDEQLLLTIRSALRCDPTRVSAEGTQMNISSAFAQRRALFSWFIANLWGDLWRMSTELR